jgi:hypothetical protein
MAQMAQVLLSGVAVEKLPHQKTVEKNFALGCPTQTTISVSVDILNPPNFGGFQTRGLFQDPQAFTLTGVVPFFRPYPVPRQKVVHLRNE